MALTADQQAQLQKFQQQLAANKALLALAKTQAEKDKFASWIDAEERSIASLVALDASVSPEKPNLPPATPPPAPAAPTEAQVNLEAAWKKLGEALDAQAEVFKASAAIDLMTSARATQQETAIRLLADYARLTAKAGYSPEAAERTAAKLKEFVSALTS